MADVAIGVIQSQNILMVTLAKIAIHPVEFVRGRPQTNVLIVQQIDIKLQVAHARFVTLIVPLVKHLALHRALPVQTASI